MKIIDSRGLAVSMQSASALANDPDFAMAHSLRADIAVMSSEQAHVAAAQAWMEDSFERAVQYVFEMQSRVHDDITLALELVDASQLFSRIAGRRRTKAVFTLSTMRAR